MNIRKAFSTVLILTTIFSLAAAAQDLQKVKQRMKDRVDELAALKTAHVIGEDRDGFLAIVNLPEKGEEADGMKAEDIRQLVKAENDDRGIVYKALAEKVQATPEQLGKARAKQIYDEAGHDVLLKTKDGEWVTKGKLMDAAE